MMSENKINSSDKQNISALEIFLLGLIIVFTIALVLISQKTSGIILFDSLSEVVNKQIVYQSSTLLLSFLFLAILFVTKKDAFRTYFKKGDTAAPIIPEPYVGIKPKEGENWSHIGKNFAVVVSLVTGVVIYFQLFKDSGIGASTILKVLPFSILFALSNSFVEEVITRLGVVLTFKNVLSDKLIPFISAAIFGTVHYWGNPGGLTGVLVAGFLGWLLAKSIIETKGIFWAWLIHFLQDVIIFCALLSLSA